jgi:hypothetical protein
VGSERVSMERTERAGNGANGKRCEIDGMTRTGELAGVSESSRRIDGQAAEGRGAELGKRSINTSRLGIARVDGNAARECKSARPGASTGRCE